MARAGPWRMLQRLIAGGRTVADLAERLGTSARHLRQVPVRYRSFAIAKRSGGFREIQAPEAELKRVQRAILRRVLAGLPMHPAATAFEPGRSIVDNARPHVGAAVLVNLDLVDFFPSVLADRVGRLLRRIGWGRGACALLLRLTTHQGSLPQGAPTSPRLANLVCRPLDRRLASVASGHGAAYTRYADDLTFSLAADERWLVQRLLAQVRWVVAQEGFRVHRRRKLSVRRGHQRQEVTGLVVNAGIRLPRETRRWLRAVRHRAARRMHPTLRPEQLAGWAAFERMVDGAR